MILYPHAKVRIYSNDSIESIAIILSENIFCGIPFGGGDLGIFDEVPALRLERYYLGLFVALHGYQGEYTLLIKPNPERVALTDGVMTDISNYVASMIRATGLWRVEVPKA